MNHPFAEQNFESNFPEEPTRGINKVLSKEECNMRPLKKHECIPLK